MYIKGGLKLIPIPIFGINRILINFDDDEIGCVKCQNSRFQLFSYAMIFLSYDKSKAFAVSFLDFFFGK